MSDFDPKKEAWQQLVEALNNLELFEEVDLCDDRIQAHSNDSNYSVEWSMKTYRYELFEES